MSTQWTEWLNPTSINNADGAFTSPNNMLLENATYAQASFGDVTVAPVKSTSSSFSDLDVSTPTSSPDYATYGGAAELYDQTFTPLELMNNTVVEINDYVDGFITFFSYDFSSVPIQSTVNGIEFRFRHYFTVGVWYVDVVQVRVNYTISESVETLTVNGDGTRVGFDAEGYSFSRLQSNDGIFAGDNVSKIYTPTINNFVSFSMTNTDLSSGGTIAGLAVAFKVAALAGYTTNFQLGVRVGGTNYLKPQQSHFGTRYSVYSDFFDVNPATGNPWTSSEVDSAEILMFKSTNGDGVRVTYGYAEVYYTSAGDPPGLIQETALDSFEVSDSVSVVVLGFDSEDIIFSENVLSFAQSEQVDNVQGFDSLIGTILKTESDSVIIQENSGAFSESNQLENLELQELPSVFSNTTTADTITFDDSRVNFSDFKRYRLAIFNMVQFNTSSFNVELRPADEEMFELLETINVLESVLAKYYTSQLEESEFKDDHHILVAKTEIEQLSIGEITQVLYSHETSEQVEVDDSAQDFYAISTVIQELSSQDDLDVLVTNTSQDNANTIENELGFEVGEGSVVFLVTDTAQGTETVQAKFIAVTVEEAQSLDQVITNTFASLLEEGVFNIQDSHKYNSHVMDVISAEDIHDTIAKTSSNDSMEFEDSSETTAQLTPIQEELVMGDDINAKGIYTTQEEINTFFEVFMRRNRKIDVFVQLKDRKPFIEGTAVRENHISIISLNKKKPSGKI